MRSTLRSVLIRAARERAAIGALRRALLLSGALALIASTLGAGRAVAAGVIVTPTSGLSTTEGGGTATFTVALDTQPTDDVTIGLSSSNTGEGTVSPTTLTFTATDWNQPQTVTIHGVDDAVDDGDVSYSIVTAAAVSLDPAFGGVDPNDVAVTNIDNDTAGIGVTPTSGLTTTESGGSDQFTIVLQSQPTGSVTIGLSSSDATEGTVSPSSVTFTTGNWNVAQTVTVTGVDDAIVDGPIGYTIVTAAATSSDPNYNGVNPTDVSATNSDNEAAGFAFSQTSGLVTTEAGGTATFTVTLLSQPTANVSLGLSSSNTGEGTVSPTNLNFTSGNWNNPHTVTITGVDDAVDDGDIAYSIVTAAAVSTDPSYGGANPTDISVTNTDNDVAGITVSPTSGLVTTEAGGTATFTVVLTSQPTASVALGLSSTNTAEGTVAPAGVTFTTGNWNTPQTVTVTGVDDPVVDGPVGYTITTAAATSGDSHYSGLDPANVSVTNNDNDAVGITVTPTSGLTTTEAGGTATFTMVLTSQPTADVTVGLSSTNTAEGTVAPASVTFTAGNWNVAQTVTVTGVDDAIADGAVGYTITTAAATSGDPAYNGVNPANVSVTNADNDVAGFTVDPTAGLVTSEAGGSATFTIVLRSQPTASVSVGLSSSDVTEGTVAPASVTFTSANWNVAQTVTVTGVDDAVADGTIAYSIVTAAATSSDPTYNGVNPADVSASNTDNDAIGIAVTPTAGLVTTEAGGTATFTIVLNSQPTANVSIGLTSTDLTEGTVAPASVTFTGANWNVAQTVTVTGVDDAIVDGTIGYTITTAAATSTDPAYNGLNPANVSVTNSDNDAVGITVNPTAGLVTTEGGGQATFTLVLTSQPSANVTIGLSSTDLTEGTVAPNSVTFTNANWNVAQTVTVTGVDDAVVDGAIGYTITTAAASSADPNYSNLNPANVSVTNSDNDAAGITVTPTAGLVTTEAGGTATFTVVLTSQPTANVVVGISSSDLTEGTVSPTSLSFTAVNWSTPRTVTVTGVDDPAVDGPVAYTIVTAAATSSDLNYSGFNPSDVSVSNSDNDAVGITVSPTAGLVTTEAGGSATFTVVLASQPSANVTIGVASSDPTEGSAAPASLTFTSANWNVAQTVTVTGVDDPFVDGPIGYSIVTAAAASTDPGYGGFNPSDVSVTNNDNDAAGVTVSPTAGLVTSEAGGTATFTLVLNSQPTANVSIGLTSTDLTEGTVAPASVTFTNANWNVAQTVTVTGVDDAIVDGAIGYTITTAATASADPVYNGVDPANVSVTNSDNDAAGITVTPTSGLTTTEAGGTATFTVVLNSQPSANVTIGITSSDLTEGTVAPTSLTFTPASWNVAQTVTVTGVDDAIADGAIAYSAITAAASSADPAYSGLNPPNVAVTNADNDLAGFAINPVSGLVTTEAGGTATFTIALTSQPAANVSVALSSSDLTEGTVAPASVTFNTSNWNLAQTVTVTGVDDAVADGPVGYSVVTAAATSSDPNYTGRNPADVSVTNNDNDVAGITASRTAGLVTSESGGTATFTLVLRSQPTANVTIGLSSSDPTEGTVAPASVTFTSGNWNVAQTVTATGVDDAVVDGAVAYTIVTEPATSADASYSGLDAADVSASNSDNDVAGITVSPTAGLVTSEAGGTATFTVVLTSQPADNVTVGLASSNPNEGTVAPGSVTFTSANWNVAQTVTVTGVDDAVADGAVGYSIVTAAATSADPGYNGQNPADVSVTNNDNDSAGITVSPTSGLTTTEAGGTATFTIVLLSQPSANVTIGLSTSDATEGTVAPANVTFTPANWNLAQTVTVTGVDDALADGPVAYTILTGAASSADAGYNGVNPADVSLTNNDNDVVGFTLNPPAGLLTSESGGTATFTVALRSQPTADVTLGLSSSDPTEGSVTPTSLTFTAANWNVARTVTVTGVDDPIIDGAIAYTIVTAPAASADPNYNGLDPVDVSVSNTDNDVAGVTVTPTLGLITTEAGGTATFTLVLTSQPTANVSIGLNSSDVTEGTVAPSSVVFTPAGWNVAQTVTVTGVDDFLDDGNIAYSIQTLPAVSSDPAYNGVNPPNVVLSNIDNDAAGVTVTPAAGLLTSETGGTATFTMVLTSQPTANVTLGLSSNDLTEGTVAPASLVFTPANWNVLQTVTVTGVDDPIVDGTVAYTIVTAAAVSADAGYNGFNPVNVSVTNADNDVAGFVITPTAGLVTSEAGGSATFTVALATQPALGVAIALTSSDLTEGTVAPPSLSFTAANWNVPQTVTVTGVDDLIADGTVGYTIVTSASSSADPNYNGINPPDISVSNTDNDAPGVTVSPTAGLVTSEAGGTATFIVVLNTQPLSDVAIGLSSSDASEGSVAPSSLSFGVGNWNVPQTVTVTGVDDLIDDGNIPYTIVTAPATGLDPVYNGLNAPDVSVTNVDNDSSGVTVSPVAGLTTTEAGGTATFVMVLRSQPTANVTIALSSSDLTEGTVTPASLTFTGSNWSVPRTVTVTGVDDVIDDGDVPYTIVTAAATSSDPTYNGLNPADVAATNVDNDAAGVTVSPVAGLVTTESGGTATFTMVLASQPSAGVTIGLSSSDITEGTVAPASVTFTPADWNLPQTVTVTGVDDAVVDGAVTYTIVTAPAASTDPGYAGLNPANVSVSNTDNDAAGFTVNPLAGLVTTEAGGTATFTVALTSQPGANVTTALSSSDATEGSVSPAGLTFTNANWNVPQTVTVTGLDDFLDDGNVAYTIVTAPAVSTDGNFNGVNPPNVSVTNADDDSAGVAVTPTAGLVTSEAGGTAQFTVVLQSQPTASVTIGLSSSDVTEGTVTPPSLTFSAATWNVAQTVTVTGVDDPAVDGAIAYTVVTAPAASADPVYNGINPANVSLTNSDNDAVGITVAPVAGLTTSESGGSATFTVALTSQPVAPVVIGLASSDTTEGTVAPARLTFTAASWNVPQTAIVTGVDDFLDDGPIAYTIVTAPAVSTDPGYNKLDAADVSIANQDDDAGVAVAMDLVPDHDRVSAGQPVRYTLFLRNLTALPLTRLEIHHDLPARFGYLAGSAALDGRTIADPADSSGGRTQVFSLDSLPGFVDHDGDGKPGPGEPGYAVLGFTLVPGASATSGAYLNSAIAVALSACSGCPVSNRAEATVEVEEDQLFGRGTILGRVFDDRDRDGRQGPNERGVAGAVIALDDGSQVISDGQGRFHVPDLDSGPRALKLDLARLGMPAVPTTDPTQVVNVSPGLLATVRFGISFAQDTLRMGHPLGKGLAIVTDPMEHAVHVAGNAVRGSVLVNGRPVPVRTVDARLDGESAGQTLVLSRGRIDSTTAFATMLSDSDDVQRWWLDIRNGRRDVVQSLAGDGVPPALVPWDGGLREDYRLRTGEVYTYQLHVEYADSLVVDGPRHAVGVERGSVIALTLAGDAFQPGKATLTLAASEPLMRLARDIQGVPREVVVIEGYTDSIGPAEANRQLSQRRAEAVANYLVERGGIARGRLVVEGHGATRPVASNATEDGRELNRRVEIYGMSAEVKRSRLYDVFHGDAIARIDGLDVPVDAAGRFACRVPTGDSDTIQVALTNRLGRTAIARLRVPMLQIRSPRGELLMPFGKSADGVRVEPRSVLLAPEERLAGPFVAGGERAIAHVRLQGRTDAGNRVELDGESLPVGGDGSFTGELALHVGENTFSLVVRDPGGTQREASLVVRALDQEADRETLLGMDHDPELTIYLPPRGTVLDSPELRLAGQTSPGNRVVANRDTVRVEADGSFFTRVMLPEGRSVLAITVEDSLGRRTVIEREIEVRSRRLFLVGLADGVVGRTKGGVFVGADGSPQTWTEGRIAYQLKGWIAGGYFINSAMDTRRRDFQSLFKDLDDAGRDRLLVNLDPDRLYPVFGDSSALSTGGLGGGRFYLAVDGRALHASIGDLPIAFDQVELAPFHRTLYGGQVRLVSGGGSERTHPTTLSLFGAQARNVHVRDAIRATGGTLYYLSHHDVLEGSVQVALVVNDRVTGLPLRRMPLQRGADYGVKELEGRLLFSRPVASVWEDGSLVDGGRLYGQPVTIEVDYETRGSLDEKTAVGGRLEQQVGRVTVGATALNDQAGFGQYQLGAGDLALKLGAVSRVGVEYAHSDGRTGRTYASFDGGIGYDAVDTASVESGSAWKVAAELSPGEWRPHLARLRLGGYVRRIESGFVAEDHPTGLAHDQSGFRAGFDAGGLGQLSLRFDQDQLGKSDSTRGLAHDVLGLQWRRDREKSGLATEFESRTDRDTSGADSTSGVVAARVWLKPAERIRTTLEQQLTVNGASNNRTSLGVDWKAASRLTLGAVGSTGSTGRSLNGSATLTLGTRSAYLRQEQRDGFGQRSSGTVFGIQAPLGSSGRTYTEYQWLHDAAGDRALSVMGLEQGWHSDDGFALRIAGEHGSRQDGSGLPAGLRTTLSSDLSYRGAEPLRGAARGEVRLDRAPIRQRQYLVSTHLEYAMPAGLSLTGDYRLSLSKRLDTGFTAARYEERSLGLAFRPLGSGRVQTLARVTRLDDRRPSVPGDSLTVLAGLDVAALEASVRITPDLEWSGKGAARIVRDAGAGLPTLSSHGSLWVNRLDYTVLRDFRLAVEYRTLSQRETDDTSGGWLQEVTWDPAQHMRFGVGYNFTRFSGEVVDRGEQTAQGWFVRAQSRY